MLDVRFYARLRFVDAWFDLCGKHPSAVVCELCHASSPLLGISYSIVNDPLHRHQYPQFRRHRVCLNTVQNVFSWFGASRRQ